jgi:uncharacterized MAPEG superfamily protein
MMRRMELIACVTALALIEYVVFGLLVGQQRIRSGIQAPATTGDPVFERYFRVHQNTLEQLIVFIPALWLFGRYVSPAIGALLGLVFVVSRVLYLRGYVREPGKRALGVAIGAPVNLILLIGGLIGALVAWF